MAPHCTDGSEVENGNAGAAALLREIEALRRRLTALEARLPENAAAEPPERRPAKARSSANTVVRLTTGAGLAMLAGGVMAYGADALIIEPDGVTIAAKSINFGKRLGALLTLYDPDYAIGIQHGTLYQRSYKNFAWYKGGGHTDTELDPGGGSKMMSLTDGNLDVAGAVKAKSLDVDGTGSVTAGTVTTGTLTAGTLTVSDKDKGLAVSGPMKIDGKADLKELTVPGKDKDQKEVAAVQIQGTSGRNMFMDSEQVGPLRVGAAFGVPGIWSEKGDVIVGSQTAMIRGQVLYQKDDEAPSWYLKPLSRYHMTLTAANYGGRTKTIPNEILYYFCGTRDGCEVRLARTGFDDAHPNWVAARDIRFYYSASDKHWTSSNPWDRRGVIGGGGATDEAFDFLDCVFTDKTWENRQDKGNQGTGMQLYMGADKGTCELTIIP